ncbi:BTAD domain-containing putative transcriptional regulator [Saccharothrix espanaensis]|uniref:BTAD domain-containing putative transcriptional regulator n=1 Tax=Saccharothrix espanaensis TaxID=103731 RepID=UPI0002DD80B8|nr:BTAD domain-containing putative transcriptional regulator [Saccharothrix espanaensis]
MRFAILGPLRVERDGVEVPVGGPRQRDLLALLLVRPNRVLTADWLADALWDGRPPASAAVTLRTHVAGLRRALEPGRGHRAPAELLRGHAGGYELAVPPDAVDAVRFTALADDAAAALAAGDAPLAEHRYRAALALWRGEVAVGLAAVRADVAGLVEARLVAREGLGTAAVALGRHHEVLPDLRRFVTDHPEREHARGQLMLALYRAGRQTEALAVYDEGRRVLLDEHGVTPGEPLRALHRRILAQDVPALVTPPRAVVVPGARQAVVPPAPPRDRHDAPAPPPATAAAPRAVEADGVRVVGRERELAVLDGVLVAARHAGGRVVAVVGEAGIGKTSLARVVGARAAAAGTPVVWARCPDIGQTPPFWLWTQVVRALSPDGVEPALAGFTGPFAVDRADRVDPSARFRAYDAVAALVHAAAADAGLVLVLDDLHAADPDSLLLLRYLAPTLHTSRALVVATLRPYEHDPDVVAALADVARSPGHRRVHPAGLDADAVADLVRGHTGSTPSAAAVDRLVTRTGGNPFFLTELLTSPEDPPPSIRDTVRRRLHALDDATRDCLDLLSVAGRDLDVAAVGTPSPAADHLVTETAPGVVGFRHPLFAEATYADLSPTRRAALHARLADTAGGLLTPAELAHHYGRARDRAAEHLRWTLEAAEDATRRLAFEDALTHLDRAAGLLTDPAGKLAAHLRRVALLQITVGVGSDAVAEAAAPAHHLLARLGGARPADLAATLWTLGELACNRADFPLAADLATRLLAMDGDALTRTAAHYLLGVTAYFAGRLADAEDHLTTALDHLDERLLRGQTGRRPTLAVHEFRALVRSLRGLDAQPDLAAARALAERTDDPYGRANAELFAGWAALQEHDVAAAERAARECRGIGVRGHMAHFVTTGDFFAEWAALRRGDAAGPAAVRAAADGIYRLGLRATRTITVAALADAHLVAGHVEQAAALADEGLTNARALGEHVLTAELHRVRGLATGDAHDLDTGRAIARAQGAHLLAARFD